MSEWRRAQSTGRRDDSEPEIEEALKAAGCSVRKLSGKDIPDLLVGLMGFDFTIECKTGNKPRRPGQQTFYDEWLGNKPPVIRNAAQARVWAQKTREYLADLLKAKEGR